MHLNERDLIRRQFEAYAAIDPANKAEDVRAGQLFWQLRPRFKLLEKRALVQAVRKAQAGLGRADYDAVCAGIRARMFPD